MIRSCVSLILVLLLPLPSIANESIDFDLDVLPVLTRAGCNAGSCHGAAVGRGGFHLSLWGSNPARTLRRSLANLKDVASMYVDQPKVCY